MLVDGLHMIQLLLPGTPIVYYADELGVQNTYVRWDQSVDPAGRNVGPLRYAHFSRDFVRSPFPWDDSRNAGMCIVVVSLKECRGFFFLLNIQSGALKRHSTLNYNITKQMKINYLYIKIKVHNIKFF